MERCYIISYDVAEEGDYNALHKAIQNYGTGAPVTESTWAVVTGYSAEVIRDRLSRYLPDGSRLFVIRSGVESAWWNALCDNKWLKRSL